MKIFFNFLFLQHISASLILKYRVNTKYNCVCHDRYVLHVVLFIMQSNTSD